MTWTEAELAILRLPITAAEMEDLMPHRSNMSIRLRRRLLAQEEGFTPVNPRPDYAGLGRLAGAKMRAQEAERKARFILAVVAGALPSHNDVVSRSAYQRWRKSDAAFMAWFDRFKSEAKEARQRIRSAAKAAIAAERNKKRLAVVRATEARAAPMGENHRRSILQCDVFRIASDAIGRRGSPDARDAAISAMVLDLLEGALSAEDAGKHAAKYRTAANSEISFMPLKEVHDSAYSMAQWQEAA